MKVFHKTFLLLILTLFFSGCVNTKKYNEVSLYKNQQYYTLQQDKRADRRQESNIVLYQIHQTNSANFGLIEIDDNLLTYSSTTKSDSTIEYKILRNSLNPETYDAVLKLLNSNTSNVFPSPLLALTNNQANELKAQGIPIPKLKEIAIKDGEHYKSEKLKYYEGEPVFQAMSIPFKYRSRLNDSIPGQVTTSANLGFAIGYKFSHRSFTQRFRGNKVINSTNPSWSLTPGFFVGPTIIELKNGDSVNTPIELNRKIGGITYGIFLVAGVNKFNIGLAYGFDTGLGRDSDKWIYQNKGWYGFVLALDFIK